MLKFNSLPNSHKTLYTSIDGLELFSCNLDNEDESALSILDPVTITLEIKPPSDALSPVAAKGVKMESKIKVGGSEKKQKPEEGKGTMQTFEVNDSVFVSKADRQPLSSLCTSKADIQPLSSLCTSKADRQPLSSLCTSKADRQPLSSLCPKQTDSLYPLCVLPKQTYTSCIMQW